MASLKALVRPITIGAVLMIGTVFLLVPSVSVRAQQTGKAAGEITFTHDIAPILQRSCQNCHRPDSVAPMSLLTYEDVRPWAKAMKFRTGLGTKPNVMPPWY